MSLPLQRYTSLPKQFPRERRPKIQHLFFNVNDNRILVTDPGWHNHAVGTIEVFVKFNPAAMGAEAELFGYFNNWNNYFRYFKTIPNVMKVTFMLGGVLSIYDVTAALRANTYYALAVTQDGSDLKSYINARLVDTELAMTKWFNVCGLTATSDLEIGLFQTWSDLVGYIALVRYYSRALSEAELQENRAQLLNPSRTNLEMYLEAEEGQGATVFDQSGNGKDGAITSTVWDRLKKWEVRAQII